MQLPRLPDPVVRDVLARLVDGHRRVLGDELVGSYLFGSAATGWFEPAISDVDVATLLRTDPTPAQLARLERLYVTIVDAMPEWDDRIEVVYLSSDAIGRSRAARVPAARISPGEPFHAIEIDDRWLIDWYQVRTTGLALSGPPAESVVPPIPKQVWIGAVRRHLLEWPVDEAMATSGDRAYAVLSMCRGLRTCATGEQVSKREGARWAQEAFPEHLATIADALARRSLPRPRADDAGPPDERPTVRFLRHAQGSLAASGPPTSAEGGLS